MLCVPEYLAAGEAFDDDFFADLERSPEQRGRVMKPALGDEEAYWHVGDGGLYENSRGRIAPFALPQADPDEAGPCGATLS
jgi:hypothetical protein